MSPPVLPALFTALASLVAAPLSALGEAQGVASPGRLDPAPGVFLVAHPRIMDPRFQQSVLLIIRHDKEGTLGVMINRPTPMLLSEALPDMAELEDRDDQLYIGGPVTQQLSVLINYRGSAFSDATHVFKTVFFSMHGDTIKNAFLQNPDQVRVYAGYAGWAPGQLGYELRRGDWHLVPAKVQDIFADDVDDIWRNLNRRQSTQQMVIHQPLDPAPWSASLAWTLGAAH